MTNSSTDRFTTVFIHPDLTEETMDVLKKSSADLSIPALLELNEDPMFWHTVVVPRKLALLTNRDRLAYEEFSINWDKVKTLLREFTLAKGKNQKRTAPWYTSAKYGRCFLYSFFIDSIIKGATGRHLDGTDYRMLRNYNRADRCEVEPFLHVMLKAKNAKRKAFVHTDAWQLPALKESTLAKWLEFTLEPANLRKDEDVR